MQSHRNRPTRRFRLALYRLARRRAARGPIGEMAHLDPGQFDPATAGWRATIAAATGLVYAGRLEEADGLVTRGLAAFPDDPSLLVEHALVAHRQRRFREAITRLERALAAAPDELACHDALASNLREVGETAAAARVVAAGQRRFPRNPSLVAEAAHIAEAEGRFADALALYERIVRRRDAHPDWLRGHAHALVVLGRFDAAQAALAAALARHPDSKMLLAVEGILASSREDWPKAMTLWAAYRRRFPEDGTGWEHYGRAVQGALLKSQDDRLAGPSHPLSAPLKVDVVDDEALRALMLRFESLGDSCEFGSVQRRYAAEPLGLLRWNDVRLPELLAALAARFEGMGAPENTEMPVIENGEYTIRDTRWSLWMHTFLFEGQTDPAALYPKMCRRVAYLRDKLIEDLTNAEKIFVYRTPGIDTVKLAELHTALEVYGPVKLLVVQPVGASSDLAGAAGEVMAVGERRWIGFLSRLGVADGNYWDIAFEDWVAICRQAADAAG